MPLDEGAEAREGRDASACAVPASLVVGAVKTAQLAQRGKATRDGAAAVAANAWAGGGGPLAHRAGAKEGRAGVRAFPQSMPKMLAQTRRLRTALRRIWDCGDCKQQALGVQAVLGKV